MIEFVLSKVARVSVDHDFTKNEQIALVHIKMLKYLRTTLDDCFCV